MKTGKKSNKKKKDFKSKQFVSNMKAHKDLDESYIPFVRSFVATLLAEAEALEEPKTPDDFTPEKNAEDFQNSLDQETPTDNFDTQGTNPNATADIINAITEWSGKLDKFASFINDPNTQSLHKIIAAEDRPGSLLRGITRKASDAITRIAGEVEKLKEVLNQFIIMAPKKQRDTDQLKMG